MHCRVEQRRRRLMMEGVLDRVRDLPVFQGLPHELVMELAGCAHLEELTAGIMRTCTLAGDRTGVPLQLLL